MPPAFFYDYLQMTATVAHAKISAKLLTSLLMKPYHHSLLVILILIEIGMLSIPSFAEDLRVTHERLVLVCANLKNASALVTGGSATSVAEESKRVSSLTDVELRKEILKLVDNITESFSKAPRASRPDIYAYSRDARLAMIDNRKEPFSGHRQYIIDHPKKAQKAVTDSVQDIKKAVMQLKN